jgi:hypothetical protein
VKKLQNKGKQLSDVIMVDVFTSIIIIDDLPIEAICNPWFLYIRFTGTIVGMGDPDSGGWPESKWRSLRVSPSISLLFG